MTKWVALLRGINVGGKNRLPMEGLRAIAEALWPDCNPQTYIASGNMIFEADDKPARMASDLGAAINEVYGLDVPVLVFADKVFRKSVVGCPFEGGESKGIHAVFCFMPPVIDLAKLAEFMIDGEGLVQDNRTIWLNTPQGISNLKLAAKLGQVIGYVPTTARNLNTLRKLVAKLDD